MTTIGMVDPGRVTGKTRDVFDPVLRREENVFGATAVSNIWRCQGHVADDLEADWERSCALMQRGRFTPLERELVATAASRANAGTY